MKTSLTFLFTSDEHGYSSAHSRLQPAIARARQENPEGTLLISSGDVFEGSAETGVLGLDASRQMLAAGGYDLMTLGNHDFDRGADVARGWAVQSPCPIVLANVKDSRTGELLPNAKPYRVFEKNGVKVGLVGVTTPETTKILPPSRLQGLTFEEPTQAVREQVDELRKQGVEVIGLVSHLGLPADREMARAVPELDFILGGHTHDALSKPEQVGQTLIAHPDCFRKAVGRLDLEVEATTGEITGHHYELIRPSQEPASGPVGKLAQDYSDQVDKAMGQPVGRLSQAREHDPNRLGESMEDLIGDAALDAQSADLMLVNQKVVRTGLPAGEVTRRDVFNAFPLDNRFVTLTLPASEVLRLEAESLRRGDQTSLMSRGRLTVATDVATRELELLHDSKVFSTEPPRVVGRDEPIKVITSDYLLSGGLGYFSPGQAPESDIGLIRDTVTEYFRKSHQVV